MPTKKQTEANRRNAQHSTGPKTPTTKAASSHNSLTHGLLASDLTVLADPAARAAAAALLRDFNDFYLPRTPIERALIRQMAILQHRLEAAPALESGILTQIVYSEFRGSLAEVATIDDPEKKRSKRNQILGRTFTLDCEGPNTIPKLARYETLLSNRFLKCVDRFLRSRQSGADQSGPDQPGQPESLTPYNDSSEIAEVLTPATPKKPNEPNSDLTPTPSATSEVPSATSEVHPKPPPAPAPPEPPSTPLSPPHDPCPTPKSRARDRPVTSKVLMFKDSSGT